jgi:hypothetical protein
MFKWARIAHLNIWNTSYGQKKGQESNCQFDSRPQKVGNRPNLLSFKGRATYCWKALDKNYDFASNYTSIRGFLAKLWGSKVAKVLVGGISGLPLESPGKNNHLDVTSVDSCRVYYKGERGGFPQVRAVVNLVCSCCQLTRSQVPSGPSWGSTCRNPSFGLATKAKGIARVRAKGKPGS